MILVLEKSLIFSQIILCDPCMYIVLYVFAAVHIMLLPSQSLLLNSYSLLKFVYVTKQLRHSIVVHPSWICPSVKTIIKSWEGSREDKDQ